MQFDIIMTKIIIYIFVGVSISVFISLFLSLFKNWLSKHMGKANIKLLGHNINIELSNIDKVGANLDSLYVKPQVFLAYSFKDQEFVKRLSNDIKKGDINTWIASEKIKPGDKWQQKINEGIRTSEYLLAIITKSSLESKQTQKEFQFALKREDVGQWPQVIPILRDDVDVPAYISDKVYIDFRKDYEHGLEKTFSVLKISNMPNDENTEKSNEYDSFSPNLIYHKIDEITKGLKFEPSPGFLRQIISQSARKRAKTIEETRESAIVARKKLISGLDDSIKIYRKIHESELKIKGATSITKTFITENNNLYKQIESTVISHINKFFEFAERIDKFENMSNEQKEMHINENIQKANNSLEEANVIYKKITGEISKKVQTMIDEIEKPIK